MAAWRNYSGGSTPCQTEVVTRSTSFRPLRSIAPVQYNRCRREALAGRESEGEMTYSKVVFVAAGWSKRISSRVYATAAGHPYHSGRLPTWTAENRGIDNR